MTSGWQRWIHIAWLLLVPFSGNAVTPILAADSQSSIFLNGDGSVWGTGFVTNYYPGATSPVRLLQLPGVVAVASADGANLALLNDGSVWASGRAQSIDGTSQSFAQPVRISVISGVTAIAAYRHVLAVKNDGTVWAWGSNENGQLGDGTKTDRYTPAQVIGLTDVTKVAASFSDSLALKSDGTVWVWGYTCCGAAGDGINPVGASDPEYDRSVPTQVRNLDRVTAIAAGHGHHMALRNDGTVWSWGWGGFGQNGTGSQNSQTLPVQVPGLDHVVAIEVARSGASSFAVKADGTVWAWGSNDLGVLGIDGVSNVRFAPIQVPGLADIVAISTGWGHVLAMRRDGAVFAWGSNDQGQLGNGWFQDPVPAGTVLGPGGSGQLNLLQPAPTSFNQLPSGRITLSVASGRAPLAIQATATNPTDPDGTVMAFHWRSSDGQSATGQSATFIFNQAGTYNIDLLIEDDTGGRGSARQPVTVTPVSVAVTTTPKVGMSANSSIALANDGRIIAWGESGKIGLYDASALAQLPRANSIPMANGISGAVDIGVGSAVVHVLLADGTVLGWGSNASGQVGSGSSADHVPQPQQISGLPPTQALAEGLGHSLALTLDGRVFSWGDNTRGQLGVGDNQNRSLPIEIAGLTGIIAVAAGYSFSAALKGDGTVWIWGNNDHYQFGNGTTASSNRPVRIPGLPAIKKIFSTPFAIIGQDAGAAAWVTGNVGYPALGDAGEDASPRRIALLDGFVKIAGGYQFLVALKADGTVWTGGLSSSRALGVASGSDIGGLQALPGISDVSDIAAGSFGAMALRRDGTVLAWGLNDFGQIGDGTLTSQLTPALVVNETVNGFLDLIPEVPNTVPRNLIPPFFLATYLNGGLSSTTLYADITGIATGGGFSSLDDHGNFAAGYNVYVAANVPSITATTYFQLNANNSWSVLNWPMAAFLSGVALDSQTNVVTAQILQNTDLSSPVLAGTSIILGYGTDPNEMLSNGRYRTIFTVPSQ